MSTQQRAGRAAQWRMIRLRRLLAAVLAGTAAVVGLAALRPSPEPTTSVVVAARDLEAGHRLTAGDLRVQSWPRTVTPPGPPSRRDLAGRRVLGPVRAGEAVTASRLVSSRTTSPTGADLVVSVPLADPGLLEVLSPGNRVDLFDAEGSSVAHSAHVLTVSAGDDSGAKVQASPPSVLVAVSREEAGAIARARATTGAGSTALLVARSARSTPSPDD